MRLALTATWEAFHCFSSGPTTLFN